MDKINLFQPTCVNNFNCIGGDCEDSCCKDWNITIDKETYLKYKSIEDKEIKLLVDKKIKLNKKEKDEKIKEVSYAYFVMGKDGKCPFWQEDGLCLLHKKLGPESLCRTCKEFPRSEKIINNTMNYTLSTACPEAARLILKNKDGLKFEEVENKVDFRNDVLNVNSEILPIIKDFSIELMQYREISLEERLILLASIFDTINNDKDQIKDIVSQSKEMLKNKDFEITIDENMRSKRIQFDLFVEMYRVRTRKVFTSSYLKYVNEIWDKFNMKDKNKSFEIYKQIKEKKYDDFLKKYEYMLENYLVNRMFVDVFPYSNKVSLNDKCKEILIIYSLLKSFIICCLHCNENIGEEELISIIQGFTANMDHKDNLFAKDVKNALLKVSIINLFKERNNNTNSNEMAFALLDIALSKDEKLPFDTVTEVIYFFV